MLFFLTNTSFATPDESIVKLNDYLVQEKINLTKANNEIKAIVESDKGMDELELKSRQKRNATLQSLISSKIAILDDFFLDFKKQQQNLSQRLKALQQLPLDKIENNQVAEDRANQINALKDENNKIIKLISEDLELAKNYQATLLADKQRLDLIQANMAEQQHLDQLRQQIKGLERERDDLYQANIGLQQAIKDNGSFEDNLNLEARLLLNNQAIILIQHHIVELVFQKKRIAFDYLLLKNQDVKTISSVVELYKTAIRQLSSIAQSLKRMQRILNNEKPLLSTDNALKLQLSGLQKKASLRLSDVLTEEQRFRDDLAVKEDELNKKLGSRQSLAQYHLNSWPVITNQLLQVPVQCYNYVKLLSFKVIDNYHTQPYWSVALLWVSLSLVILVAMILGRVLHTVVQGKERSSMTGHLYDGALILLYRNMPHLTAVLMLVLVFFLNQVMFSNYQLIINLFLVWLTFRNLILIARLMLLERISDSSGNDVKLYYRLQWLLLVGGWSTALMVLGHQLPLSLLLQDIFNRLFMLFLLALSLVAWNSKDVIPDLLSPLLITKKRYLRKAISLLVVLIPLTLLTTAIIGLVGYIDLAWTMSRYQALLLLVMTGYVLARGLILDGLDALSKWMISKLHNGWLWIEVILKPLDAIARVLLFLSAIFILFQWFGWTSDSHVVARLTQMGAYPFVNLSGAHISLFSAMEFVVLVFVFVWFAKWTREFCFRWLYRHVSDPGIRNSLAVFTQYAVIILGGLLTLRVLGIDFSGMAIVFGGLAVGMGFGLRDFASNIVGGVMLLIERPVREGDLITLGEYEGRVAHIGIRTMRVSSWDNMEVLIPNAETFNKPFTNWTHQDSIVRTVVPIKVNRADDPWVVQQLILDVLTIIPDVLNDPPCQVLLKQIDDVLIEFEIRYFINVQTHTRFEVRSKVLFAIMAQFKAANIKAPIPSINVDLNHEPVTETPASK